MGRFDSSRSRVAPVFDRLRAIDQTGRSWLPTLLSLPAREPRVTVAPSSGPLKKARWWPEEERLPAPKELLRWLVQNAAAPQSDAAWGGEQTKQKRISLTHHDPNVIAEAMKLLDGAAAADERAWYVLEGPSCPDVFLESDDLVVVIEGKRTEPAPTTTTTWMPVRHQMLRHLDAAWDRRGDRQLLGFFIVEGDTGDSMAVPAHWREAARNTTTSGALAQSMPHRSQEVQQRIGNAFIGVTTWQAVCRALSISEAVLIDEVV